MPFDKQTYDVDYVKKNQRQYMVKINRIHDADMLEWMDTKAAEGYQTYIKNLIRADMEAHGFKGSSTEETEE